MGSCDRFYVIFEKHFGLGLRWDDAAFWLELSLALPFVTFVVGLGPRRSL